MDFTYKHYFSRFDWFNVAGRHVAKPSIVSIPSLFDQLHYSSTLYDDSCHPTPSDIFFGSLFDSRNGDSTSKGSFEWKSILPQ